MRTTRITPSRCRSIGPRERDFMLGQPTGDFEPEPMYLGPLAPVEVRAHTYECDCPSCRECRTPAYLPAFEGDPTECAFSAGLPFTPDPSHSGVYGSVRYGRPQRAWEGDRAADRVASVLAAVALSAAVMACAFLALVRLIGS